MRWETTYFFFQWEQGERNELLQWEIWSSQLCRKVDPSDLQNPPESSLLMQSKKNFFLFPTFENSHCNFSSSSFSPCLQWHSHCCFPSERLGEDSMLFVHISLLWHIFSSVICSTCVKIHVSFLDLRGFSLCRLVYLCTKKKGFSFFFISRCYA